MSRTNGWRISFLVVAVATMGSLSSGSRADESTHAADRPNIIFIMSDDHAAHAISAYQPVVERGFRSRGG